MVFCKFSELPEFYPGISIDNFILMPNHLHAIILIQNNVMMPDSLRNGTGTVPYMTVSDYVQRFKSLTTKAYIDGVKSGDSHLFDKRVWQKSYHDHIIRNEQEYQEIWEYVDTNPLKWQDDEYFAL